MNKENSVSPVALHTHTHTHTHGHTDNLQKIID